MHTRHSAHKTILGLLLALTLGLLAACGSTSGVATGPDETSDDGEGGDFTSDGSQADGVIDDGGEPIPIDLDALQASTWTLRFGGGPDGDIAILDGAPITISFSGDTFGGVAACNGYGGSYSIELNAITLGAIGKDDAGCPDDIRASEGAFLVALADVDGINLVGDELALSGMSTELIFFATDGVPEFAVEDAAAAVDPSRLEGVEWVFVGGDSPDGLIADPRTIDPAASITLMFAEGRYTGTVICNGYGGSAEIGTDGLLVFTLGVPEGEEEGCYDELDGIPEAYLDALPLMFEGALQSNGRGLVIAGSEIELLFERAE